MKNGLTFVCSIFVLHARNNLVGKLLYVFLQHFFVMVEVNQHGNDWADAVSSWPGPEVSK